MKYLKHHLIGLELCRSRGFRPSPIHHHQTDLSPMSKQSIKQFREKIKKVRANNILTVKLYTNFTIHRKKLLLLPFWSYYINVEGRHLVF